jgi:hypothetical protein
MMSRIRPLTVIPFVVALAALGCGGGNPAAPASISGSVTLNGKALPGGSVSFFTQAGSTGYTASIGSDGTYSISDVPMGDLIVCVETESANPEQPGTTGNSKDAQRYQQMMGDRRKQGGGSGGSGGSAGGGAAGGEKAANYVKIDKKFSKPQTSPLTYTAKNGRNVYNIELK